MLDILNFVGRWWDIIISGFIVIEYVILWLDSVQMSSMKSLTLESIVMTMWWFICNFRNGILFGPHNVRQNMLIESLVDFIQLVVDRNTKVSVSWVSWFSNPILAIHL